MIKKAQVERKKAATLNVINKMFKRYLKCKGDVYHYKISYDVDINDRGGPDEYHAANEIHLSSCKSPKNVEKIVNSTFDTKNIDLDEALNIIRNKLKPYLSLDDIKTINYHRNFGLHD